MTAPTLALGDKMVGLPLGFGSGRLPGMSVQEIKDTLATLPRKEQDEVIAFLFQLRHVDDSDYQSSISRRLHDKDRSHWLSPEELKKEKPRMDTARSQK